MFRVYPTIFNVNAIDYASLQSRLDNAILEARKEKDLFREQERQMNMVKYEMNNCRLVVLLCLLAVIE